MARKAYRGGKYKGPPGGYIAFPHVVLNSQAYLGLSSYGRMLLMDLAAQYKGNNNGDLCAAWKLMKKRGWHSEATLAKAKKELLASDLIVETRMGARPNRATLFALTWRELDFCDGKLEMQPNEFPYGKWRLRERVPIPPPRLISQSATVNTAAVVAGHA